VVYGSGPVLLGDLCAVLGLGLGAVLMERGYVVITGSDGDGYANVRPRAIVLDLDSPDFFRDAEAMVAQMPGVRVIGCSADRSELCLVTRAGAGRPMPLEISALVAAIA
jgi:hypothetical protein